MLTVNYDLLNGKKLKSEDIHCQISEDYGKSRMNDGTVRNWVKTV